VRDGNLADRILAVPLPLAQPPIHSRATLHIERSRRIVDAPRVLALWHLTSLDAPSVAVAWSLGIAWVNHLHLALQVPFLLAVATWTIYVCDRLLDARTGLRSQERAALRERHYFHWRHRIVFVSLAGAATCAGAGIALRFLPTALFERGTAVAAASLAYFSGVHARREMARVKALLPGNLASKEMLVAILFAAGCLLPAWPRHHDFGTTDELIWRFWVPGVYFAALAWLNCSSIERWEMEPVDISNGRRRSTGLAPCRCVVFESAALLALCGLLLAFLAPSANLRSALLLTAGGSSALLLALLDRLQLRMTPLALRATADLVMLTPLVFLFR
jgi:hypothetical protein